MMSKTKLGISVGFLAAGIYASGLLSAVVTVMLAGYVLLREEDEWLRKSAVKAVAIILVFGIFSSGIGIVQDLFRILDALVGTVFSFLHIGVPFSLDQVLNYLLDIMKTILLISCSFQALNQGPVRIGFRDKLTDKAR